MSENDDQLRDIERLVAACSELLHGHDNRVQGAALADLVSIWLAGHFARPADKTAAIREKLLQVHVETVRKLIPLNEH